MALVLIRKKKFLIALEKEIKSHFNCRTWWLMERGMPTCFFADSGQQSRNSAKVVLTSITITLHRVKATDIHHILNSAGRDCI